MAEGMGPCLERPADATLVPLTVRLQPLEFDGNHFVAAHVSPRP
jgi:hypothetical protein